MSNKIKNVAIVLLSLSLLAFTTACSRERRIESEITAEWKYALGDNQKWADPDFDDSSWAVMEKQSVPLKNTHYAWIRAEIPVPAIFETEAIWLGLGKSNSACEVYADGHLVGARGIFPPRENVRMEESTVVNLPRSAVYDGKMKLAVRLYGPTSKITNLSFYFANTGKAHFENLTHNMFGQRLFLILGFLCLFIMFYTFAIFVGNPKDLTYLNFAICLFFISIYFLDIGMEFLVLPYSMQRSLCRACLPVSLAYMALFLNRYFDRPHYKKMKVATWIFSIFSFVVFFSVSGNQDAMDLVFNLMLIPVVFAIVYGFVTSIKGLKHKENYPMNLFLAFTFGSILAIHDVVYSIMGKIPFMWTQALAFFVVDLAVFITLSMRSSNAQKAIVRLMDQTEEQHKKLTTILKNARSVAEDTSLISEELENSVLTVTNAARTSKTKVEDINQAIHQQSEIHIHTEETIKELTESLYSMNTEFDRTTESIKTTANGTQTVVEGIENVSEGIYTAENFTRSLNSLTTSGSKDVQSLSKTIELIQNSSKEILSVVSTIDDFAKKTDLLAMNASIEAAHAGIAGKGFAVIAHEIKNLAAQSSARSGKISEIITGVIKNIESSVDLTDKVNKTFIKIKDGAEQSVEKVSAASNSIKNQIETSETISKEAVQLSESAARMKQNVEEQRNYSSQVLENMENLSTASLKVDQASSDISKQTAALAEQVESLRDLAARTKEAAKNMKEIMNTQL